MVANLIDGEPKHQRRVSKRFSTLYATALTGAHFDEEIDPKWELPYCSLTRDVPWIMCAANAAAQRGRGDGREREMKRLYFLE